MYYTSVHHLATAELNIKYSQVRLDFKIVIVIQFFGFCSKQTTDKPTVLDHSVMQNTLVVAYRVVYLKKESRKRKFCVISQQYVVQSPSWRVNFNSTCRHKSQKKNKTHIYNRVLDKPGHCHFNSLIKSNILFFNLTLYCPGDINNHPS